MSKVFNNVLYTRDQIINIDDNQAAAYICCPVNIKHLLAVSIPWAQGQYGTRVKPASQEVQGFSNVFFFFLWFFQF